MNVERVTHNFRRVKHIAPAWNMVVSDAIYYLAVVEDGKDLGAFCFHPCDETGLLMHVELGHDCRGAKASKAYEAAFQWMFDNTEHETLRGRIPGATRHARVMARHVGASYDGVDCDALQCYSITKYDEMRVF